MGLSLPLIMCLVEVSEKDRLRIYKKICDPNTNILQQVSNKLSMYWMKIQQ